MLTLNDFRCEAGHITEQLVDNSLRESICPECDLPAKRLIAAVRCKLDHTFPGAGMKWERMHEQEAKRSSA